MTSRLDRLFVLLENCPNASLRAAAAEQLGEVARNAPSNINYVFTRLVPLLRHKNWISRVAASDAIRSIVHHLPDWDPTLACSDYKDENEIPPTGGFLSLNELRLDRVLAQGARLYSMDARELEKTNKRAHSEKSKKNDENALGYGGCEHQGDGHSPHVLPPIQRQEINSRLGLENDSLLTQVLEVHADVSINKWITPDDLVDEAQSGFTQLDVEACIRSTYGTVTSTDVDRKRSIPSLSSHESDAKRIKLDPQTNVPSELSQTGIQSTSTTSAAAVVGCNRYYTHWPLDKLCTTLLSDLWALRWETRHGAASGLRELLSEPRHTRQAGKHIGQTEKERQISHCQYLEDIVVRVLCTLALDQLSDFISDEVVAPVRETAAQLLGVLSLHLTVDQVVLIAKHLIFLVSLNDETVTQLCNNNNNNNNLPDQKESTTASKNSWMIAHGGLLGIKYLLASRKDLKDILLPHVAPCLISRLFGIPIVADHQIVSQHNGNSSLPPSSSSVNRGRVSANDDDDIRAAAGSALLPIIDTHWIDSLSQYEYNLFVNHVWSLIRNTPSDLSPSTGPVLSLICALTKAECGRKRLIRSGDDESVKLDENVSTYQISTSAKIMIITKLLHHVSSSIRQSALNTLQCVIESCENQVASLSVDTLHVILDNLFQRILLESCSTIRTLVTNLTIKIIKSAQIDCLVQASIRRLDVWLCQVMQPTGVPYPTKFLVPCLQEIDSSAQSISELNLSNNNNNNEVMNASQSTVSNTTASNNNPSNIFTATNQSYCIGGYQCLAASRSEMESYVLETRISAVRVLANLCARVCQYTDFIPNQLLPCISDISESPPSVVTLPSSANDNNNNGTVSMINFIFGQLLCQLHLKDRLAMQRFISGLLLSTWALSSPFSLSSLDTTHKLDNSSSSSSSTSTDKPSGLLNDLITPLDRSEHLSNFHKLTHTWANLLNAFSSMSTSSTSSPILLSSSSSSDLSMFKNLSNLIPVDIQNDLKNITKQLHGKLESCLTEVIYYEEILAPFKLMQEDCRELIRSMKMCGLSVDPQIPVNGVLTIAHCKALLQTVANTIQQMENASSTSSNIGIDSSLLDRLNCQFERTRTTVDHCLTLQLYLGNRVELGIACAFANMNWILPGRLSLLIRPLMDTIRCMKPSVSTVGTNTNTASTSPTTTPTGVVQPSIGIISNTTTTTTTNNNNNNASSNSVVNNTGNACIDILPIGTCVHLQRLAACCLARLMWLEWRMLLNAAAKSTSSTTTSSLSTMSKINEHFSHMMMNTSKAAVKVIKNLTSYLIESDPELLQSSVQNSTSKQSETNNQFHEDQLLDDVKMVCTDQIPTGRLDMDSTTTSTPLSSYESQCQSAQYRGAYIALSCICYTFITFYHCEEINEAYQVSNMSSPPSSPSSLPSSLSSSKGTLKPLNSSNSYQLKNNSLNSLRFGLPTLWNIFWLNPINIIIDVYRPHIAAVGGGVGGVSSINNSKKIKKRNNENDKCKVISEEGEKAEEESHYSLLKRLTHDVKLPASSMNANSLSKSTENELLTGLTLLSTCLNVILPCIDPDKKTINKEEEAEGDSSLLYNDDISFEQIVWLGALVIRLPYPTCRRIGARLLADLTLLQPVHTLNILLPILLSLPSSSSLNDGSFLMSGDLSTICIGALETFLTIVDKFTNIQNASAYMLHKNPPVVLNDPLLDPDSKSSCSPSSLLSSSSISTYESFNSTEKHASIISESKITDRLTGDTVKETAPPPPPTAASSNPVESSTPSSSSSSSSSSLPDNLKLFLPYLVLLLTPTLKLISSANQEIRSVAGKLFTALLNLLPLEASIPNPVNMKEEFKLVRGEQREFIDSLLHPNRIQVYNLPIKINATLRSYQQEGVNWLCFLNRYGLNGILCDDLGLGKTLQTICILAGSHHELKQSLLLKKKKQSKSNDKEKASSVKKLKSTTDKKKKKKPSKSMPTSMKEELDEPMKESLITANYELSNKQLELPISLVICPSTLCGHWSHEIQHYAQTDDLKPLIYAGNPAVRQSLLSKFHQYDVIITSYDSVRSDIEYFQSISWNYVILDEGHIIKSSKSKVTRAVKQLIAQHRLILTGTPIQNRVSELWSLFDFLMPEFLGTEQHFLAKFARPVAVSRDVKASKADQRAGQLALEKLHRLVLPFMLRRLKEDVMQDLPPKIIQDFACKMTPIQRKLYESFQKTDEGKQLMNIVGSTDASASANATSTTGQQQSVYISSVVGVSHGFQAVRYFQAVCNHPCLVLKSGHPLLDEIKCEFGIQSSDQLRSIHLSGKLLALCRLLTDCGFGSPNLSNNMPGTSSSTNGNNSSPTSSAASTSASNDFYASRSLLSQHRALIFFQTREMLQLTADMLRELFPWITATRLDGSVPVGERHNRVVRFNQDPSIDIMLLTTAVGGLGLNLTGADTVIFVEHDWNPCKDLQAMDRAHRIGQSRTVNVYRLITEESIEEQIMNLQAFKLHLANTILTTDNKNITEMDTEHLFDRLSSYNNNNNEEVQHSRDNHHQYDNGQSGFALLDELETCYEVEYNLDAFIARLKTS